MFTSVKHLVISPDTQDPSKPLGNPHQDPVPPEASGEACCDSEWLFENCVKGQWLIRIWKPNLVLEELEKVVDATFNKTKWVCDYN